MGKNNSKMRKSNICVLHNFRSLTSCSYYFIYYIPPKEIFQFNSQEREKKNPQIKDQIKDAILKEELVEGDALPSIQAFANDLKVSVLTIRRVYEELEQEGFIVSQVGIGTFVSTSNLELLRDSKRRLVEQKMADMIQTAKSLKISKEELNSMMDILYEED